MLGPIERYRTRNTGRGAASDGEDWRPATVTSGRCLARLSSTAGSLGRDSPTAHAHDGQPVTHV